MGDCEMKREYSVVVWATKVNETISRMRVEIKKGMERIEGLAGNDRRDLGNIFDLEDDVLQVLGKESERMIRTLNNAEDFVRADLRAYLEGVE